MMLRNSTLLVALGLSLLCAAHLTRAQTWDGGGTNDNWSTPQNWAGDVAPNKFGLATVIFGGTTRLTPFVDSPWNPFQLGFDNTAGPFVISGSALGPLSNISNSDTDLQTINNPISLGFSSAVNAASGPLLLGGNVDIGNNNSSVSGAFNTQINGILGGAGRLIKNGTGTLTLGGASANTFTGETTVNEGILILNKPAGNAANNSGSALAGPLIINPGGTVRLQQPSQLPDNQPLTIGGTLEVNGIVEGVTTDVTFNAGSLVTGSGTFVLGANLGSNANATAATISGNLSLNGGVRTFNVKDGTAQHDLDISAVVSSGGIVKEGPGTLRLSAVNTFAGGVTLNSGTLMLSDRDAAGTGNLRINGGAVNSDFFAVGIASHVTIAGSFTSLGSLQFLTGATLAGSHTIQVPQFLSIQNIGEDAPGRGFTKTGAGRLTLIGAGNNTYTGATTVNEGTLRLSKSGIAISGPLVIGDGTGSDLVEFTASNQVADTSTVTVNSSGQLFIQTGLTDTIGQLTMTGGTVGGTGELIVNNAITYAAGSTFTATITSRIAVTTSSTPFEIHDGTQAIDMDVSGRVSGTIQKTGAGTLRLSGTETNSLSFGTFVGQGMLVLDKTGTNAIEGLVIGDSAGGPNADVVRLDASNQINDLSHIRISSSGLLNLNGFDESSGQIEMRGGNITTAAGTLTLGGAVLATTGASTITGNLSLGAAERTFLVTDDAAVATEIDLDAIISNGSLTKTSFGTMRLSGASANTYTGATTVQQGTLLLAKPAGVNAIAADLTIGNDVNSAGSSIVQLAAPEQISNASTVTMHRSGVLNLGNFFETVRNFTMHDGFVTSANGILQTSGTFTYNAGLFHGRLHSTGTAVFNGDFNPSNGMDNFGSMTIDSGRTVSFDGEGLSNPGVITLSGGTISGSGNVNNAGTIIGAGAITGSGALLNLNQITITGGSLDLAKSGVSVNSGNIDVPAGSQLRLLGSTGSLQNNGTINLAGGSVSGLRPLTNNAGGTIAGRGLILPLDINRGTLIARGGTLNIGNPLNNPGVIRLIDGAGLAGAVVSNTGVIQGDGSVSNAVNNTGTIDAVGTLVLAGALSNDTAGLITAGAGASVVVSGGLGTNPGTILLTGGTFHDRGPSLNNSTTGKIRGHGVFRAAALNNSGEIAVPFANLDLDTPLTNTSTAKVIVTGGATATFHKSVGGVADTEIRVSANSAAVFLAPVTGPINFTGTGAKYFEAGASAVGPVAASGATHVLHAATLVADHFREDSLTIEGNAAVRPNGTPTGTSKVNHLSIGPAGQLDLADNAMIVDYTGPSVIRDVRAYLRSGYSGGAWTGPGLTSSSAAANPSRSPGYGEASDLFGPAGGTFQGLPVDGAAVLVRFTLRGDATLDGKVSFPDLVALAQNYNTTDGSALWTKGDFNYDGNVTFPDLVMLAQNYNTSLPAAGAIPEASAAFEQDVSRAFASVPEPILLGPLAILTCSASGRRRRR